MEKENIFSKPTTQKFLHNSNKLNLTFKRNYYHSMMTSSVPVNLVET